VDGSDPVRHAGDAHGTSGYPPRRRRDRHARPVRRRRLWRRRGLGRRLDGRANDHHQGRHVHGTRRHRRRRRGGHLRQPGQPGAHGDRDRHRIVRDRHDRAGHLQDRHVRRRRDVRLHLLLPSLHEGIRHRRVTADRNEQRTTNNEQRRVREPGRDQPLLRRPVARPLMVRWMPRWTSSSRSPARHRSSNVTWRRLSGSRYGNR
jgi:hypothetical protein